MKKSNNSGMALIVTLGFLTVIALAVVALVITLRIERLAARNTLDRAAARQYVDVGLAQALEIVDCGCLGRAYPVGYWTATNASVFFPTCYYGFQGGACINPAPLIFFTNCLNHFQDGDCLGTLATNISDTIRLFRGSVTNLVPTALAGQASNILSGWTYIIVTTNGQSGIVDVNTNGQSGVVAPSGLTAGRVAFLVINLSGFMDAHILTVTNRATLGEPDVSSTAWQLIAALTNGGPRTFLSQLDLTAANNGNPLSNLVTFSYDPNPDVFFTNNDASAYLGTRAFLTNLVRRTNVNDVTNLNGITSVSGLLADAGVQEPDHVAYNILNYISPGRIPKTDSAQPYRTDYGVKDVPLINEVVLQQIPGAPSNHYGVAVELWYPFVPNTSTNAQLWVGVYTNEPPNGVSSFDGQVQALPNNGISFKCAVTNMNYGVNEFFVGSNAPSQQIYFEEITGDTPPVTNYWPVSAQHPIWIWPQVFVGDICVDEALVDSSGTPATLNTWTNTGSIQFADPRANQTTNNTIFSTLSTLGASNINCTVNAPLILTDAPMLSAGELRHIYAPGMTNACLDLATPQGAACRDRFTVRTTNAPMRGLVQANTPYTNIWKALLSDITVGWSNSVISTLTNVASMTPSVQQSLAEVVAGSVTNTSGGGWLRFQEMLPTIASNIDGSVGGMNNLADPTAVSQRGDLLAGMADRVSFRQNVLLVIVCAQRLSPLGRPLGRPLADQRAAAVVVRDAFTGRWVVNSLVWLTE